MGYKKVVQYGNITEIYDYEKALPNRKPIDALKAHRLYTGERDYGAKPSNNLNKKRREQDRAKQMSKGLYTRSSASIKRSRQNFFRLCHHNNVHADSIHFLTLTFSYDVTLEETHRHLAHFMERIKKAEPTVSISYISVPELTEKGRFHLHLLVYNLPTRLAGRPIGTYSNKGGFITTERETRNLQRLFQRGYVDIIVASHTSTGIAGYMAKYMAKSLTDTRYKTSRGYNCSQNIKKVTSAGSNSLIESSDIEGYDPQIVPTDSIVSREVTSYDVPYMGTCTLTKITQKICTPNSKVK